MPIGGSSPNKTFTRQINAFTGSDAWEQLEASGRDILSADQDYEGNDHATAINACLFKDGSNFASDIPTSGQKFTGVGNASARTHFAAAGQVQDSSLIYAGASSGTDTITATLTPAITAYAAGQIFLFRAGGTNTGAATINFNSVGAADVKKGPDGTTALAAGDITSGGMYAVMYNSNTSDFELLNPGTQNVTITTAGAALLDDANASAQRTTLGLAIGTDVLGVAADLSDVSDAATAFGNIKQAASTTATGVVEQATSAEVIAKTADKYPDSALLQYHPGVAKFFGYSTVSAGSPTLQKSDNVTSITDSGVGLLTTTIASDMDSANYVCHVGITWDAAETTGLIGGVDDSGQAAGTVRGRSMQTGASANATNDDPAAWHVSGHGVLA